MFYLLHLSVFVFFFVPFRMDRPNKITFLDSDGTTAFEYRVPKGQSDMVRRRISSKELDERMFFSARLPFCFISSF